MALVLVDAENVRRSLWPNLSGDELVERAGIWAEREGHEVRVVFEGKRSADEQIAAVAAAHDGPLWVVTSDRELRRRVERYAEQVIGGGGFVRLIR